MPELGAVLDLRGAVMDRDPEPDLGCAADLTGGSSPPPCALPARQVLPQLQVALRGEGVGFEVDPEPTVDAAGEWRATLRIGDGIVGESAG